MDIIGIVSVAVFSFIGIGMLLLPFSLFFIIGLESIGHVGSNYVENDYQHLGFHYVNDYYRSDGTHVKGH